MVLVIRATGVSLVITCRRASAARRQSRRLRPAKPRQLVDGDERAGQERKRQQRGPADQCRRHDFDPSWMLCRSALSFRTSRGRYEPDPVGTGTDGIFIVKVDPRMGVELAAPTSRNSTFAMGAISTTSGSGIGNRQIRTAAKVPDQWNAQRHQRRSYRDRQARQDNRGRDACQCP